MRSTKRSGPPPPRCPSRRNSTTRKERSCGCIRRGGSCRGTTAGSAKPTSRLERAEVEQVTGLGFEDHPPPPPVGGEGPGEFGGDGSVAGKFGRVVLQTEQGGQINRHMHRRRLDDRRTLRDECDECVGTQRVDRHP